MTVSLLFTVSRSCLALPPPPFPSSGPGLSSYYEIIQIRKHLRESYIKRCVPNTA